MNKKRSYLQVLGTLLILGILAPATVLASTTEEDASEFNDYCPGDNERAVFAEYLPGHLEGWVNLVCLDEIAQQTQSWFINPEGVLLDPTVIELPERIREIAPTYLVEKIENMDDSSSISLWVNLVIEEPYVGTAEDFGGPSGGVSGSSSVGGAGEEPIHTYEINGLTVTEQEFSTWMEDYRLAEQDRYAEYRRLSRELTLVKLYELVDLNQWHDWFDISLLETGESPIASWAFNEYSDTLQFNLNGTQAKELLATGTGILFIEEVSETTIDADGDIYFGGDAVISEEHSTTDLPTLVSSPTELEAQESSQSGLSNVDLQIDDALTSDSTQSSGGVSVLLIWLILLANAQKLLVLLCARACQRRKA